MVDEEELRLWLSKSTGLDINEQTIFFDDLRLTEDDLEILINDFITIYDIDMTGFDARDYGISGARFFESLIRKRNYKTFKLKHLCEVVKAKRWIVPG
ncbi:MAG: DUF1493 family protein [Bacteroidetes bacterium]|nr:DUF1493 family protein [Bacteroidota bacterium]